MEKVRNAELSPNFIVPWRPSPRRRAILTVLTTAFLLILVQPWTPQISSRIRGLRDSDDAVPNPGGTQPETKSRSNEGDYLGFNWSTITPATDLKYQDCYNGALCARLSVPLDWFNNTANGQNISVAVTKVPAAVPPSDPRYGGPIFINPGGPGGSGVLFAAFGGKALQRLTDVGSSSTFPSSDEGRKEVYHDIIGFDPRGVGATTPSAYCFDDDQYRLLWLYRQAEEGLPGASNAALGRLLSLNRAMGATCNTRIADGSSILKYMSTAAVSRDMLELSRKEDEWLLKNVSGPLGAHGVAPIHSRHLDVEPGHTKLNFWGLSYGTLLGATYASMFPENVGKMILDGVLEPSDFVNHHWTGSVEDTELALQSFYDHCAAAGPLRLSSPGMGCELASNGSTAADVRERVQGVLMKMYHNPMWFDAPYGPDVVSYSIVKSLIFGSLYSPIQAFPNLAMALAAFERDDKPFTAAMVSDHGLTAAAQGQMMAAHAPGVQLPSDAGMAVECSDSDSFADLNIDKWQYTSRELNAVSAAGGSLLASMHLRCAGWNNTAYRFAGPFGGKTRTPILWIGNTADPICPIKSARNQARRFEGSVMLQHDATGHCSLAAYSACTTDAIRKYFYDATLPEPDTVCAVYQLPFNVPYKGKDVTTTVNAEQRVMMETSSELAELYHGLGFAYGMPSMRFGLRESLLSL